jgi:hypothetical protein
MMNDYQQNGYQNGYQQNGFNDEKRQLDDDAFGAKGNIVAAFDVFRKSTKTTQLSPNQQGGPPLTSTPT